MKRLLLTSLKGCCGSTTITANLAQALVDTNKQVLAIETSPENLLPIHMGLPLDEHEGWAKNMLLEKLWSEAGYESPKGVSFLPFGHLDFTQQNNFSQKSTQHLTKLGKETLHIKENNKENNKEQWQLFHAQISGLTNPELTDFIDSIDIVFVVLTADAVSYALLRSWINSHPIISQLISTNKLHFIVNQYEPNIEINRDFMLVLKNELEKSFVPVIIHRDTSLLECVANVSTVQHFAPHSQATKDFQSLAFWCISSLSIPSANT
jgi:cellulose synthase operon protein YhjQ